MLNWEREAKALLKAELARAGVTYQELASRLEALGVKDNPPAISSKISRGKFTFVFFLQCMTALGAQRVILPLPETGSQLSHGRAVHGAGSKNNAV